MSQLTCFSRPIVRHLPSLNLVVRFDDSGIAVRAYRCRKWKSVTWAQLASLSDDSTPVVKACEVKDGLRILKALGATIASEGSEDAAKQ
ncbi:MAG: hypothetical protein ACK56W_16335 [Pirellula sp.]